ncbi:MAG: hypothetical protein NW206_19355 [Hyphomonadaceae bacterium]|nr:hypothetical protein [Hyphomonadaceae bacterium]
MSNSFETNLGYGTTVERDFQSQANIIAQRVAGWVLAGNGAGLLICFNALAARSICDWEAVQPLAILFLLGIVCAFASVVFAGKVAELAAARMIKINAAMRLAAMYVGNVTAATERYKDADQELRAQLKEVKQNAETELKAIMAQVEALTNHTKFEKVLDRGSAIVLGIGVMAFGAAIGIAIYGSSLAAAICDG